MLFSFRWSTSSGLFRLHCRRLDLIRAAGRGDGQAEWAERRAAALSVARGYRWREQSSLTALTANGIHVLRIECWEPAPPVVA
jgi:hypothetical protein